MNHKKTDITFGIQSLNNGNPSNYSNSKENNNQKEECKNFINTPKTRNQPPKSKSFLQQEDEFNRQIPLKTKKVDTLIQQPLSPCIKNRRSSITEISSSKSINNLVSCGDTLIPLSKKTREIDQILSYRKDFKCKTFKGDKASLAISKLDNIYETMISFHSDNNYNQKVEIIIMHVCLKILQNTLHIITIPSESLFDIKQNEEDLISALSNCGLENMKMPPNSKEKQEDITFQDNYQEGSHITRMDKFEIESISGGKDGNFLLEKHFKKKKTLTKDEYYTDKIVGLLMSLIMITVAFVITLISNDLFNFSKKFIIMSNKSFSIQYNLIDIAKYSCLIIVQNKFSIDLSASKYYLNNEQLLQEKANIILNEITPFSNTFRDIFGYDFINKHYNKEINYSFRNYNVSLNYINAIYYMIDNTKMKSYNSLLLNMENFLSLATQYWQIYLKYFAKKYDDKAREYFNILYITNLNGLIFIFFLLLMLFLSYKSKKKKQISILSGYEKLTGEDLNCLLNKIELFELRYIELFKYDPDFKKNKAEFNTKNSHLLNKNNHTRLMKKQEAQKSKYNVLGTSDNPNEIIDNGSNKELISRENMTLKYIISLFFIFFFYFLYSISLFILSLHYYNMTSKYNEITTKLYYNKYLLNYESYKFQKLFYIDCDIINESKQTFERIKISMNLTHTISNDFASLINTYLDLFNKNITEILTGDLCVVKESIPSCSIREFSYTLKKGVRSFVSFFLKTVEESYTYYTSEFVSINSIPKIYSNENIAIQRFLIEDLVDLYDEIFNQLYWNLDKKLSQGIVTIITSVVVIAIVFLLIITYKLRRFIESIKKDEILSNRLIGEIPYDIVKGNNELQEYFKNNCKDI